MFKCEIHEVSRFVSISLLVRACNARLILLRRGNHYGGRCDFANHAPLRALARAFFLSDIFVIFHRLLVVACIIAANRNIRRQRVHRLKFRRRVLDDPFKSTFVLLFSRHALACANQHTVNMLHTVHETDARER